MVGCAPWNINARNASPRERSSEASIRRGKEPKLLVIYCIDAEGKSDLSFALIIEGTLGDADEVFTLVINCLHLIRTKDASELLG
jgi:hypothetical protein